MPIAFTIALRYLFSKKSTHAINIITGIAVLGLAIGSGALLLILSFFNGFEGLMRDSLDKFNADLKIIPKEGKRFVADAQWVDSIAALPTVAAASRVLEEVVIMQHGDRQHVGILKGVDSNYQKVSGLSALLQSGEVDFSSHPLGHFSVVGRGVSQRLNISTKTRYNSFKAYVPTASKKIVSSDFSSQNMLVAGIFDINSESSGQYLICDYLVASRLVDTYDQATAIELRLAPNYDIATAKQEISQHLGSAYILQDRYEQEGSILKIMQIEKWVSFLIFGFTLLLIIFNLIGSLWMIVLDKKTDISVLQSFGASKRMVKDIFAIEGLLIAGIGLCIGLCFALMFYWLQVNVGIITLPVGFSISSYPIELRWTDFVIVIITVLSFGLLGAWPAMRRAAQISPYVRME